MLLEPILHVGTGSSVCHRTHITTSTPREYLESPNNLINTFLDIESHMCIGKNMHIIRRKTLAGI